MSANLVYKELRLKHSLSEIAAKLFLHSGTLKRWEATQKIPNDYLYDLNFLLGNKYNLAKQNFRSHNEFFTKKEVAKYCFESFLNFLQIHKINANDYTFIEPSCGDLSFYELMPKNSRIGVDLEYKNEEILCQNFLSFIPQKEHKKYIILGNPPFGLRGNLALRFINHAGDFGNGEFADFIAFILPPLFDSDGKGSPKKRIKNYELAHSEKLPLDSFVYPNGKGIEVATLFQIWVHKKLLANKTLNLEFNPPKTCKEFIKVYSLSDGGTPSSTRNKAMLYKCDLYLPSTCFHSSSKPQMKIYTDFETLPHRRGYGIVILKDKERVKKALQRIDWVNVSFLGTNSSLNLRTSLIEEALISQGFYDKGLF
ncbi:restriction endonuclease subunit M [Campylobacter troglodytis]|nr:restriction endonuclease subunit M [Campylobacter troglodytis]